MGINLIFKYLLTNDKILVNSISFNIKSLLIDIEQLIQVPAGFLKLSFFCIKSINQKKEVEIHQKSIRCSLTCEVSDSFLTDEISTMQWTHVIVQDHLELSEN